MAYFPSNPSVGDLYTFSSVVYKWDGTSWNRYAVPFSPLAQVNDGTITSNTALDVSAGYSHKATVGAAFTISFTNWASSGNLSAIEIQLINGGAYTITWPTINWYKGDGTYSTTFSSMNVGLQSSGTNVVLIWTTDGGTTLYGRVF